MPRCIEIKTERLVLRTLTEADAATVRAIEGLFGNAFETDYDALEWIRWANNRSDVCYNFYVWLSQSDEPIGHVYMQSKAELEGEVELAYGMKEAYRRKQYATEAAGAVVRFAFAQAKLDALAAIVKPENVASRRVIEKLGFRNCGTRILPDENGEASGFDYFRLTRDEAHHQ